jgi:hypothetical protein
VLEIKAKIAASYPFRWVAPALVDPTAQGNARPALVIRYASGDSDTVYLSPRSATVASITAAAGSVLTSSQAVAATGLAGRHGQAWLVSDQAGAMAVKVVDVDGTAITLADAPSRPLKAGMTGTLTWATWTGTVPSKASAERNCPFTVSYTEQGVGTLDDVSRVEEGLIHWVKVPFSTGLTHEGLCRMRPELASSLPDREQGLEGCIEDAEDELIAEIRRVLAPRGLWEDDIVARPRALKLVHADLAAAHFHGANAASEAYRARALGVLAESGRRVGGLLDTVLQSVQTDVEHSGSVDGSREQFGGPRTTDTGGAFGAAFEEPVDTTRRHRLGGRTFVPGAAR